MEEDIHNEFKKHIGAACISYNAEQSANVKLQYDCYHIIIDVWKKIYTMNSRNILVLLVSHIMLNSQPM